jgi:hypothetical protein
MCIPDNYSSFNSNRGPTSFENVIIGKTNINNKISTKADKTASCLDLFGTIRHRNDKSETGCKSMNLRFRESISDITRLENIIKYVETPEVHGAYYKIHYTRGSVK